MKYRADIDGLRAIAVLSVVIFHAFPASLPGGFTGVDIFFVISGYLICGLIYEGLEHDRFGFVDFFARRVRRIFPALILVMSASLAVGWLTLLSDEYAQLGKHVASGSVFLTNFVLMNESGYFDGAAFTKPMLHLWSLAVEEQFYLIWPLALWLAWRYRIGLMLLTCVVALASFASNVGLASSLPVEIFFLPTGRFWELLSGGLLAWVARGNRPHIQLLQARAGEKLARIARLSDGEAGARILANLFSVSGAVLLACGIAFIDEGLVYPGGWAVIPVLGAVLVIAAGPGAWLNRTVLMSRPAVWIGLISYPLYLWHWPILSFLRIIEGESPPTSTLIAAVILSIVLAWLTYIFIEKPIRLSKALSRNAAILLVAMLVPAIWGSATFLTAGFPARHESLGEVRTVLEEVQAAIGDWEYPDGLVNVETNGKIHPATSSAPASVVFFGDSHIEQYGPRVRQEYEKGLSKEVTFVTAGGCPPIPEVFEDKHVQCRDIFQRLESVLESNPVETVVLGGSFNSYLIPRKVSTYYYEDKGRRVGLGTAEGVELAMQSFRQFCLELAKKYKVVVLLDNPRGPGFDPKRVLNPDAERRPVFVWDLTVTPREFAMDEKQKALEQKMETMFAGTPVETVRQSQIICPDGLCRAMGADGRPIYKDRGHMRPWFMRKYMDVLDSVLLK